MPIDPGAVGREGEPRSRSWDSKDALLYAVGVGAGLGDPTRELEFTTENSDGVEQRVLPTFAVLLSQAPPPSFGEFDRAMLVHAEQHLVLHRPVPVEGTVTARARVVGVHDKGSGALVTIEATAVLDGGEPLATNRSAVFIRGEGGFGGDRGPKQAWSPPDRAPDHTVTYATRPEQALLYRLSGDRNPLHSDPTFAAKGGFDTPILHGLCTYGVTGRALVATVCGGDPDRLTAMSGRFSATVLPGQSLTVDAWRDGGDAWFRTSLDDGTVVLDHGRATVA
ncbi:MaoC/PaaZ C-terminal domain-containing protein [Pseudonocardia benzenivorans]|jgi:acyl dehydratase|uniref:3-alpha,7-alpha, 12-alpha-trihydroxy-5-beta-cholest-24-enoyl-CoAhydratase n=2 Tax=Pseudonocardia TaxID=1847 RepID=F4CPK9_PSEUX|nr:MaoC/PaaZ C-terminal domain-containing protein [Pseudonocardia dioxanivorans]AEA25126.1 3-alpha,7-alpha,12-alpha-trihydroxy-5-beta-cholest-24-enoyl-CoAhydratase [Pseudonocardia dioxanivorans CB1190]GJF06682.1 3-hydroxyacyl-thioester dehydratase HtdY [Pseudonocardia sp. D17]